MKCGLTVRFRKNRQDDNDRLVGAKRKLKWSEK